MSPTPPPRLHLLVARQAPRILIIRRGPSRVYHLILWHCDSDTFEPGSWFRGMLYMQRCDLSWDGARLVYFAMGKSAEYYSWTAVSRAPWLRAELFYPKNATWHGGGVWIGPNRLWLNMPAAAQPRDGDPRQLGIHAHGALSEYGEDEGPFYRRLARDGWQRTDDGRHEYERTRQGWLFSGGPAWALQPAPDLPVLRMVYRGYYFNQGRVYHYCLDGYPGLLDEQVLWAGYDYAGRLVLARNGIVERYTPADLERGEPSLRYDLNGLTAPPPPPRPARSIEMPAPLPERGPDAQGRYPYLGVRRHPRRDSVDAGHIIRSQADLPAIAEMLRADRSRAFEKPQTYIVNLAGEFVLGGYLADHAELASGAPVLAAGEAVLEEQADRSWQIVALNNRSYDYMPGPESWPNLDAALRDSGIAYPSEGFSEVYPLEGSWDEFLAILRNID
jgi:hypothetical protein